MSKLHLSAALVLVAMFGLPAAANATTPTIPNSTSSVLFSHDDEEKFEDEEEHEEEHEEEGEEDHEEVYEEGEESFVVPPVVIHPGGNGPHAPGHSGQVLPEPYVPKGLEDVSGDVPIRVDQVLPTAKTPTDLFVDSAVVGLGAVGAGALALGTMVGVRAIRARRSGEKADYFYGE